MIHRIVLTIATVLLAAGVSFAQGVGAGAGGGGGSAGGGAGGGGATGGGTGAGGAAGPFVGTVGAGFSGGLGTAATSATPSGTNALPTNANPWRTTYGNPYSIGQSILGSSGTKGAGAGKAFGQPVFAATTTGVATTTGTQTNATGYSFSQTNLSRVPRYAASINTDSVPLVIHPPTQLQSELQAMIARSSRIKNNGLIRVNVEGETVYLTGQVVNATEKRIVENMLRTTPGVGEVENRLTIAGQP